MLRKRSLFSGRSELENECFHFVDKELLAISQRFYTPV